MRKLFALLTALVLTTSLVACGGKAQSQDLNTTWTKIQNEVELPAFQQLDETMLKEIYGIDAADLTQYVVNVPMMMVQATEIALFEVTDKDKVADVKVKIEERVKALEEQWKMYLPAEYEIVQNYVLLENGNYLALIISHDADKIKEIYENSFE